MGRISKDATVASIIAQGQNLEEHLDYMHNLMIHIDKDLNACEDRNFE